jgi:hypothetical protein
LFYIREDALVAQGFDADRGRLAAGEPVLVAPSVERRENEAGNAFSVSDTGTVVFVPVAGRAVRQLRWLGRKGELIAEVGVSDAFGSPRIAPDGARIVSVSDSTPVVGAIWITDVATGRPMRFTFAPGNYSTPVWSRTGQQIFVSQWPAGAGFPDLLAYSASGAGSSQPLISGDRRVSIFRAFRAGHQVRSLLVGGNPADLECLGLRAVFCVGGTADRGGDSGVW